MRYLSLFSGIEAATQAWKPLGWECLGVSEIEPFPCAVLAHHYPSIPNLGDVTQITEYQIKDLGHIDVIVFGSPCQNLSVAGNRKGLEGSQSSLFYSAMEIIEYAVRNNGLRFALWENVPGAFSSNKGRDFAEVVKHMAGLRDVDVPRYGWGKEGAAVGANGLLEWSVLDAQWFGLAQRRKRVFAIVDFGDWSSRPPILLECQSLRRDTPPSRDTRKGSSTNATGCLASGGEVTGTILANCGTKQWLGNQEAFSGQYHVVEPMYCGTKNDALRDLNNNLCPTLRAEHGGGAVNPIIVHGTHDPITSTTTAHCLGRNNGGENVVVIAGNTIGRTEGNGGNGNGFDVSGACYTLTTNDRHAVATDHLVVRRLTPLECERLQGFPDDFTKIAYRNRPVDDCPIGVRYKALGNSMAVPVMAWIGRQIEEAVNYEYE